MMKRLLCLALAAALLLCGCAPRQETEEAPELLEPVGAKSDTAVVTRGDLYTLTMAEGSIVAAAEELSFEIDGTIGVIHVWPGKWVEEGEALMELDQTSLKERMDQLERQIEYANVNGAYDDALAEADIEMLELTLSRLRANGQADRRSIELAELNVTEARQNLRQAQELRALSTSILKEEYDQLAADYGRNVLRAPFAGNVFSQNLTEGTSVQAEKTVAYIADPTDLTMVVSEYVSDAKLAAGRYYALIGGREYELEYEPMTREEMSAIILSGQSLTTRFRVVGPEDALSEVHAGEYAVLCVESGRINDVLMVPAGALYSSAGGRYVYVQTENGRERRDVDIGRTNGLMTEITGGLAEGDIVYVKE